MPQPPVIDQLRRESKLGSVAVYRVVALHGELVEVEVVRAPKLPVGSRFRFTAGAVEAMEVVSEQAAPGN